MADVLVVVPTYNEIDNLESIVHRIRAAVPGADVLIVDDSSPDGTGERADQLASADPALSVLHRDQKDGLGRAYLAGFSRALDRGYDFVVEIDADGSHDPAELPAMISSARSGADLVIGSRWVPGGSVSNWPWYRIALSRGANSYSRFILGSAIHDLTAGYRVFRSSALRSIDIGRVASQGYCFQVELAWGLERAGARVAEHPIAFVERTSGRSKMRSTIVIEALALVTWWGITRGLRRRAILAA